MADLVGDLGITTTAVRQQVNRLMNQGLLVRSQRASGPGRPADVFALSDRGRKLFAFEVEEFAQLLVDEMAAELGDETVQRLYERAYRKVADALEQELGGEAAAERIPKLAELLRQRGAVAEAEAEPQGARLRMYTCPYHGLDNGTHHICDAERATLSRITGGEVALERRLVDGEPCCEFRIENPAGETGQKRG